MALSHTVAGSLFTLRPTLLFKKQTIPGTTLKPRNVVSVVEFQAGKVMVFLVPLRYHYVMTVHLPLRLLFISPK